MGGPMTTVYDDKLSVQTIYAAEDMVGRVIRDGGTVDFHGSQLWLGNCRIKEYTPDQEPLLRGIAAGLYTRHRLPGRPDLPPTLRISRKAYRRATYFGARHEIVLPSQRWAMNDLVLAHEVAHACAGNGHNQRSGHGKQWRAVYAAIVSDLIGPEAGLLLMDALDL